MRNERQVRYALINYVLAALKLPLYDDPGFDLESYTNRLPRGDAPHLQALLTALEDGALPVAQPDVTLDDLEAFITRDPEGRSQTAQAILQALQDAGRDPAADFASWVYAIQRAASGRPGKQRETGVSLYHEFKLLSALVHAAGGAPEPPENFSLISGDFPGVQRFIYTITSAGATKGVRGRSFFLQLLGECIVRRLCADLGNLPLTNVLFVAGGNFLLLGPAEAHAQVAATTQAINQAMLDVFDVDVSLVTAVESLPLAAITDTGLLSQIYERLKQQEGRAKTQPLAASIQTPDLFEPYGVGSPFYCAISHREPRTPDELRDARRQSELAEDWIAPEQAAFVDLAQDLARIKQPYLLFEPGCSTGRPYARYLDRITGWSCSVVADVPAEPQPGQVALQLNDAAYDPRRVTGFRLLAAHTPTVRQIDLDWLDAQNRSAETRQHVVGVTIRDFEFLAAVRNPGFTRLGVLRMDVDGLGQMFRERLTPATLTRRIAASDALSLFFEGYVRLLCQQIEAELREGQSREASLYMLYGGGDDLFIVGEWDLLPRLAQTIRDAFATYTADQLSISAGIVLVPVKFPFYRAAEMAKAALDDQAKEYDRRPEQAVKARQDLKDAICFLGTTLPWRESEAWRTVVEQQQRLLNIAQQIGSDTVTRNVWSIYTLWRKDAQLRGDRYIQFGPYKWRAAYQMSRLAKSYSAVAEAIKQIQVALLTPATIRLSGPAARWAELERRAQGQYTVGGQEHE